MTDVYLDEKYIGTIEHPKDFVKNFIEERRKQKLHTTININYESEFDEVSIFTATGRVRRPLIIVENGKALLTDEHMKKLASNDMRWQDLLEQGVLEYLDANEEENALVALTDKDLTKEHTHMEIDAVTILGLITSLVPYANFGQSSRLNRGSKTQKQALGLYASNYLLRMDTDISILQYPQRPIVKTFMHDISKYEKHPSGQNVTIALLSYDGYNMQDALIVNEGSIQRGLARSFYFRPYNADELRYQGGLIDEIGVPDKEVKAYRTEEDYRFLEDDGIVFPEAKVKEDDVLIGKTSPPRFLGEMEEFSIAANTRRESSIAVKHGEHGVVDMVVLTENDEGNKLIQIRLRDLRIPEPGDKFASRYGQKGVIGRIVPQADMPFTTSGIVPDIIFSPHSIPSRMTISHLIEVIGGKVGALGGRQIDGTTFSAESEKDLRAELLTLGFRENGTERMYNGITGEEFKSNIFVGNMYYLKLKHMVANKMHARASGKIQLLTRQPIEGRSAGGGLRLGEMEKDCLVAHGASLLLKERFDSDKTILHICESCGMVAIFDWLKKRASCPKCGANAEINSIEMSYAFKLLLDELKSLNIYPKINLKNKY
ncbi:MAG: DNA-directed RNA polymerase subunit B' [archaeon GW2011_AR17]|nr:MAG: DNA-directed RNA polymerase subunit B' [archaeon GW2011_AR17]MBS3153785.1 DNA-directed RNA polymerase subunit B [Candidatus Woesearchaeota archaeon]HIH15189.1 DNA-directed RNA polymerase subunit B [Nanoarchaeota archaeon]HIH59455.1 DNA-directed RNA polymerase subunit B [Nanoarchaeota archaeon]HII13853.1 DNA-directed RNA polymerase subunit B [Nanoarchaeota archaeon]